MSDLNLTDTDGVRLQLFVAQNFPCSRRKAAAFIEEGKVSVNGSIELHPFYRVKRDDEVLLDGEKPILKNQEEKEREVWLLNKPEGVICSNADPQNRKKAIDLIPTSQRIYTIGRLDFNSCGMILLTNDGKLAQRVMHPSNQVIKTYQVKLTAPIDEILLKNFVKGFSIMGIQYRIESYRIINRYTVILRLNEGKNREIRKLFASQGIKVGHLCRIQIGGLKLGNLPSGSCRRLTKKELDLIFQMNP